MSENNDQQQKTQPDSIPSGAESADRASARKPAAPDFLLQNIHRRWFVPILIGMLCSGIVFVFSLTRIFTSLENNTYDWRMVMRNKPMFASIQAPTHFRNPDIVVVSVDNKTIQQLDSPSLFWTREFGEVIQALTKNGAGVIGQDWIFIITPDNIIRDDILGAIQPILKEKKIILTDEDISNLCNEFKLPYFTALLQATDRENFHNSKVILTASLDEKGDLVYPYEGFMRAALYENLALVTANPDADGITRSLYLYKTGRLANNDEQAYYQIYALDTLVASRFLQKPIAYDESKKQVSIGDFPLPHDKNFSLMINYIEPPDTFTREYSFVDLITHARSGDDAYFRKNFAGKAVLIGPGYPSSLDTVLTPYSLFRGKESNYTEMYGIEVHANFLNTILNHDFIHRAPDWISISIVLLLGIVTSFLAYYQRPFHAFLFCFLFALLFTVLSFYLFSHNNYWITMAAPFLVLPLAYSATYVYRYTVEDKEKRHIRKVLGRYVSEQVAQEILKDPSNLALGGKRADVSILFCDINDFTTYSEKTPPEEVIAILNDYFTRMEQVIFHNRGTLKQFVGDEIMVLCSAPQHDPDHAIRICTIAIEMVEELKRWQEERKLAGKFIFDVKFGVHSGGVVAGNVGSPNRTEYTTIGDVVNTTSRIMGLTKTTNARILISEETYRRVKDRFEVIDKGFYPVKGREEEVRVYELTGKKSGT